MVLRLCAGLAVGRSASSATISGQTSRLRGPPVDRVTPALAPEGRGAGRPATNGAVWVTAGRQSYTVFSEPIIPRSGLSLRSTSGGLSDRAPLTSASDRRAKVLANSRTAPRRSGRVGLGRQWSWLIGMGTWWVHGERQATWDHNFQR